MVLITSNPSEDSQGTQLRVNKKLTTVCSGKRSRFSKPRPNLAISKRGETNVPANVAKTREKSQEEAESHKNLNSKKTIEEESKVLFENNDFKSSQEKENEVLFHKEQKCEKKIENVEVLSYDDVIKNVEDNIEIVPHENAKILDSEDISVFSDNVEYQISHTENLSPNEESQAISNPDREKICPSEDNDVSMNTDVDNASKDCDIETSPVKSSKAPLKSPESEKSNASNTTPSVIDKSKYPHLTSILSKKRAEPKKETQQKRRRRKFKKNVPLERNKMTMADLIYWNPAKTDEPQKSTVTESETSSTNVIMEEENIDDSLETENNIIDSVPKLVISEDGQINIDQSSLFVSRNIPQPITTEVVRKDDTTYSSFRKRPLTKHWTPKDTANFYKALSLVGADFSLMEQIFPNRSRRELKQKFKREEKFNIDLVNKVLYESQTFDELTLNAFIDQNNAADDADSISEMDADTAVKEKPRKRRKSKKSESVINETSDSIDLVEEIIEEKEKPENKKKKKEKPEKKKKKAKKLSDDDDVKIVVGDSTNFSDTSELKSSKRKKNAKKLPTNFTDLDSVDELNIDGNGTHNQDTGELKSSKRKRFAKKLPTDFIDLDSVDELNIWSDGDGTHNHDSSEKESAVESQENGNDIETETDVESACVILNKIMNGADNTDSEQNPEEKSSDATVSLPFVKTKDEKNPIDATVSLPVVKTKDEKKVWDVTDVEEYIPVECIKIDDSETDVCMLSNVVAYEVVNTQTPPPKKRRKINSISPLKTRDYFLSTKITPASYTNYTPV